MADENHNLNQEELAVSKKSVGFEDKMESAIRFLKHFKGKNSLLSSENDFLKKQGYSDDEIKTARERAGLYEVAVTNEVFPNAYDMQVQVRQPLFFEKVGQFVQNITICAIGSYAVYSICKKVAMPYLFPKPKPKSIEELKEDLDKSILASFDTLQNELLKVETEINDFKNEIQVMGKDIHYVGINLARATSKLNTTDDKSEDPPGDPEDLGIPSWQKE